MLVSIYISHLRDTYELSPGFRPCVASWVRANIYRRYGLPVSILHFTPTATCRSHLGVSIYITPTETFVIHPPSFCRFRPRLGLSLDGWESYNFDWVEQVHYYVLVDDGEKDDYSYPPTATVCCCSCLTHNGRCCLRNGSDAVACWSVRAGCRAVERNGVAWICQMQGPKVVIKFRLRSRHYNCTLLHKHIRRPTWQARDLTCSCGATPTSGGRYVDGPVAQTTNKSTEKSTKNSLSISRPHLMKTIRSTKSWTEIKINQLIFCWDVSLKHTAQHSSRVSGSIVGSVYIVPLYLPSDRYKLPSERAREAKWGEGNNDNASFRKTNSNETKPGQTQPPTCFVSPDQREIRRKKKKRDPLCACQRLRDPHKYVSRRQFWAVSVTPLGFPH